MIDTAGYRSILPMFALCKEPALPSGNIRSHVGMRIDELQPGLELGPSEWIEVTQARVDAFAEATDDRQWIHVDPERAAAGPFGETIAHGYLTLSLVVPITYELLPVEDASLTVNYGVNRVRFPAPVPVGSRVRGRLRIEAVEPVDGGVQVTLAATVEREGQDKPVCAAEVVFRYYG
jgi:acyl dehydratase